MKYIENVIIRIVTQKGQHTHYKYKCAYISLCVVIIMLNLGEKKHFHIPCVEIKKETKKKLLHYLNIPIVLCTRNMYGKHLLLMFNLAKLIIAKNYMNKRGDHIFG